MRAIKTLFFIALLLGAAAFGALWFTPALQDRLMDRMIATRMDDSEREVLFKGDALRLVVCGSSSPFPSEDRARPCLAVIAGEHFYVVDTGSGSWNRMALLRMPARRIGGVLFTHFHSDHIGDLGEFNMQTWVAGRGAPLNVYGPEGVQQVVAGFQQAYNLDNGYRTAHHGAAMLPPEQGLMQAHALQVNADGAPLLVLKDGDLEILAFAVDHRPIAPALGYRFNYKGRSLVISGDTVKTASLVAAAQGVDLLASEAQNNEMVARLAATAKAQNRPRLEKVFGDIPSYHTTPVQAAEMTHEAGAANLLLYHLTPPPPNKIAERVFLRGIDALRPQGVIMAKDGLLLELPVDGGALRKKQLR